MLNNCDFIQVFVFTINHHLNAKQLLVVTHPIFFNSKIMITISKFE